MAELLSPLLVCGKLVFGPIYRNTKSFFKFQSNLNSLQQKQRILREMENEVKQELEAADQDGNSATPRVKEWLRQVGEILVVANQMEPGTIADNRGLISGCFLSCGVCRKAKKTLEEVERLADDCPAERVVAINHPPPAVEHIPGPFIEDQTTASKNLDRLMDLLSRDEVRSVGIWGMGGVGKTTLVKNLNNKLQSNRSFGEQFGLVIWTTVSKDFKTKMVQAQIADRLGLAVGEGDEGRNMVKLHERLMKENKFLLIFDDVWEAIDLDKLGIPKPQVHKGVKILLTSRSTRIFEGMKIDEQLQVSVLNPDEAWELFVDAAGNVASSKGIKPIAWKVCQQCCGLPLAVVIVGAAMRGKDRTSLWNDAFSELQRSTPSIEDIAEKVFKPLKWSYDKLQGNNVKSCFLYCCLYPEDYSIKVSELVKCWRGEGLIDEELNYEESRNRGLALIQNLKDACLLETGESFGITEETVKMHDVVRDVAIWISSNYLEGGCKFLVRAGIGLTQVSQDKLTKDVTRISFMDNRIGKLPCDDACSIECSRACTLFLQGNCSLVEIPDRFMRRFLTIKVLNLSYTDILSLPLSLMQLTNMRTLLLYGCRRLTELPTSGWEGLQRLQVFDLSWTGIRALPKGMQMLIKLRELYLGVTQSLKSIPAEVFSLLVSLEILEMRGSSYVWGLKREVENEEAYLEELESLKMLRRLLIRLKPKSSLSWSINPIWIGRLTSFQFYIGMALGMVVREKGIVMNNTNPAEDEKTAYLLHTTNATSLSFHGCKGLDKLVQMMQRNNTSFSALKSLNIKQARINLRGTLGGGSDAKYDLLPNLEDLSLSSVDGMKSISELAGHLGLTFSKLQRLRVTVCSAMKYVLSVDHHILLENLEFIHIFNCEELEGVFEYPQGHSVRVIPNLKVIDLFGLPVLRTLWDDNKAKTWPSLEIVRVRRCDKLRKLPIIGRNNIIKKIEGEESWWSNLEWDDPFTKTSLQHLFREW